MASLGALAGEAPGAPWGGLYVSAHVSALGGTTTHYSNNSYNGYEASLTSRKRGMKAGPGVQLGYNWQVGSFVAGLELDIDSAVLKRTGCRGAWAPETPCGDSYYGAFYLSDQSTYRGSIRAKIGYQLADFMFYVSGGLALMKTTSALKVDCPEGCGATDAVVFSSLTSVSAHRASFAYGAGVEYALSPHWRIGLDCMRFKSPDLSQSVTHGATYGEQLITSTTSGAYSLVTSKVTYVF
ncbi:MAG: porin family protein [Hyphomicrobiales bacterium]|nr:porin family protein [Hyphomicrobiales bacterium]